MSIKSIIQIILLIISIVPNLFYWLGVIRWILSGGEKGKVNTARQTLLASLTFLVPVAAISLLVFFLVPPTDTLSIALLISTNFAFVLTIILSLISLTDTLLRSIWKAISKRRLLARKRVNKQYDLFLCYNDEDKSDVMQLVELLEREGIFLWPDPRKVPSEYSQQPAFTNENINTKAAVVCVGREGIGPWKIQEFEAFLREFVIRERPVIPILLPNALQKPLLPIFLEGVIWIDLRGIKQWKDFRSEMSYPMRLLLDVIEGKVIFKLPSSLKPGEEAAGEIRRALDNQDYCEYDWLSQAIIFLLQATNPKHIESSDFRSGTIWTIVLPSLGLRLQTWKTLFLLRQEEINDLQRIQLVKEKEVREASLILVADFLNGLGSPQFTGSLVIWLKPKHLLEVINTRNVVGWLGRFTASTVEYFEPLIPYRSEGVARDFYGRTYELEQLAGERANGGIIIGTHQSGKTSLLEELSKRLKTQESYIVTNPYSYHSQHFLPFFEETLDSLGLPIPSELTAETWASTLRSCRTEEKCPVLLLDEVDPLIMQDKASGFPLGREMRALQYDGYCKFYLAGSKRLHEAIRLEGCPFRNFAQQVILKGLEEPAAYRLIQKPMRDIGYVITDEQAKKIFQGTAGVAVLIQEFCRYLLLHVLRGNRDPNIADKAIEKVEQTPAYLNFVFHYYDFPETGNTMPVMLIVAQLGEADRLDILHTLAKYGVILDWNQVDEYLEFLTQFDVLSEFELGRYRVSSNYQQKAIEIRMHNSNAFLISQLERGKRDEEYP